MAKKTMVRRRKKVDMDSLVSFENYLKKLSFFYRIKPIIDELKIIKKKAKERDFIIVNAGLLKAGKSSFFNTLIEKKVFKEGVIRTTIKNQEYKLDNNIILIDTPGLDSTEEKDTQTAIDKYKQADLIIFVHNMRNGELDKIEVEYLKSIISYSNKMIFVLTHLDEMEENEVNMVKNKISNQIKNIFNKNFEIFAVGTKVFFKAMEVEKAEDKNIFIKLSNIANLKDRIKHIANKNLLTKKNALIKRYESKKNQLKEILENKKIELEKEIEKIEDKKDLEKTKAENRLIDINNKFMMDSLKLMEANWETKANTIG